jgi:predicted DNA-binding transcriptional regulator AlpA
MSVDKDTGLNPLPDRDDTLILAGDLPKYIGIARQTLARWRHEGFGPPHVKLGGRIAYRTGDVRDWLKSYTRRNTAA